MPTNNNNLHAAKANKNDEFYTRLTDVERELRHYRAKFVGKTVLCNCDDPTWSAFWQYFHLNFNDLGLKKLISTHYDPNEIAYRMDYEGGNDNDVEVGTKTRLSGNGDFRNKECLDILDEADIVVTNPPFSIFREYITMLIEHNKQFIILGSNNALKYKEVFPYIVERKLWLGALSWGDELYFNVTDDFKEYLLNNKKEGSAYKIIGDEVVARAGVLWYTNIDLPKRHEYMVLGRHYADYSYERYDTYDAINVNKLADIPCDYYGEMGIPISFLDRYNPDQFELIGILNSGNAKYDFAKPIVNGKTIYTRLIVKLKK